DEYTSVEDARLFADHASQSRFHTIKNAGHFLDMEHAAAWQDTRQALLGFLDPASRRQGRVASDIQVNHV
ncbi:MAG: alpha/beta fold hydrolase, partial [Pseudomonas fluorescens]